MNHPYQHILVAVELTEDSEQVLARSHYMAQLFGARLSVVHAVAYVPMTSGENMLAPPMELSQQLTEQAQLRLREMCQHAGIPAESALVVSGNVVAEVLRAAKDRSADLIIIGHHPRRGLASLFSYTDEGVVHRAPCDVLALRIGEAE
jgi:universal stress protein A